MKQPVSYGAIILVGGFGTRLRPLTLHRPKALMPILNRPFLSYQFDILKKAGVRSVVLAANPAFKKWKRAINALVPKGMSLYFAFEPKPLGTGGAIRFGYDFLKKKVPLHSSVFVLNGDVLIDIDLKKVLTRHKARRSSCSLVLTVVPDISRFGLVRCGAEGRVRAFLEKPKGKTGKGAINAGVYLMERSVLESIQPLHPSSVERDIFPKLLTQGERVFAFTGTRYWNDIGTPVTYLGAHLDLLKKKSVWTEKGNLCIGKYSQVSRKSKFEGAVCLGSRVTIESDCVIADSVVMDKVSIAKGVVVRGSIIGAGCRIGQHAIISEGTVLGDRTNVPPYTRT